MSEQKLDNTVRKFKQFINSHPQLIKEIRKSGHSWQEYYEKWIILGEDDPFWEQFNGIDNNKENEEAFSKDQYRQLFNQFMSMTEKINLNKVQKQVGELNNTIQIVDELLNQFLESRQKPTKSEQPFHWFRD